MTNETARGTAAAGCSSGMSGLSATSMASASLGLDVAPESNGLAEALDPNRSRDRVGQTASVRIALKRRQLRGIVVGTVAGCGLILIAAVIARVSHASNEPPVKIPVALAVVDTTTAADPVKPPTQPANVPIPVQAVTPTPTDVPTTGTVRLERPATAGRVWIDGKKLTSPSALVECGTHQVKLGARGRARSVQIPCGGEIVLSR
ncbi:MAG: hypothetical protein M3O46_15545 [Myxococcota bacterium]|nr:hypothetical protein [Myxococcota bacterium]